jgi:hypothetical protein
MAPAIACWCARPGGRAGGAHCGDQADRPGLLRGCRVVALTLDPATGKLKSKLFVRDKGRLSWADGFMISGGYLYIADSHLWEIVFKNHLPRSGPWTIFKVKLPDYAATSP